MKIYELIAPCHFGLEAVLKREIIDLGYEISKVEDGKVTFLGDAEAICYANIFLRTAERILLKVGTVHAETFDELFEGVRALPWEEYIPENGKFWVTKATSVKSKLFSTSDIQSIVKKAMVKRMEKAYGKSWFEEDGASFPVRVTFMKDEAVIGLDTTGISLHKRGYRQNTAKAPISETLAAALIMLTPWRKDRILVDPFCGSGTFPIEAAMMAANMAPGMNRNFLSEAWSHPDPEEKLVRCGGRSTGADQSEYRDRHSGIRYRCGSGAQCKRKCEKSRSGRTDPFPAKTGQRTASSEKVWFYHHQSAVWRASGRKSRTSGTLPADRREL